MLSSTSRARPRIDFTLLAIVAGLVFLGFLALQSASSERSPWHLTQLGWLVIGGGVATVVAVIDYRIFERYAYVFYGMTMILLVAVLFFGIEGRNNAMRWLNLGFIEAQPSELMKVATIIVTARFFHETSAPGGYRLRDLAMPLVLVAVPVVLIAAEPDLGTALVVLAIFMTIVLFEGVRRTSLVLLVMMVLAMAVPIWQFGLKDYQRTRVTAFLDPEGLAQGEAYQVGQSLIAIGSGGMSGVGHGQGSQVQSGFVPEDENDFIFAHIGEEFGFLGAALLLVLYGLLIAWAVRISRRARDKFGVLMGVGIASLFFWHVTINVGMVLGLLPVVGLWLPFVSYGGSSLMTALICVGLLMNLSMRRHGYGSSR
jgi:rod shape determining protein RodA